MMQACVAAYSLVLLMPIWLLGGIPFGDARYWCGVPDQAVSLPLPDARTPHEHSA